MRILIVAVLGIIAGLITSEYAVAAFLLSFSVGCYASWLDSDYNRLRRKAGEAAP